VHRPRRSANHSGVPCSIIFVLTPSSFCCPRRKWLPLCWEKLPVWCTYYIQQRTYLSKSYRNQESWHYIYNEKEPCLTIYLTTSLAVLRFKGCCRYANTLSKVSIMYRWKIMVQNQTEKRHTLPHIFRYSRPVFYIPI
jgi:hypothetical protein